MHLKIKRKWKRDSYTIGRLYIDGKYFCDTLEDADRGLSSKLSFRENANLKVKGETAIPAGKYPVTLKYESARLGNRPFYKMVCGKKVPRLLKVPAFEGILIHCGQSAADTEGCILVGFNRQKGRLENSQKVFRMLYLLLKSAAGRGERIEIEIE